MYQSNMPYTLNTHCACVLSNSVVSDSSVTPWTVAYQAPLSMGKTDFHCKKPHLA